MLEVLLNSTLDGINKNLGLIQALMKERFKFLPDDGNVNLILQFLLVLLPAKQSGIFEKNGGK